MQNNISEDNGLFGDILVDVPEVRLPLAGVHRSVIEANGSPSGERNFSHTRAAKQNWNAGSLGKGWLSALTQPFSLVQVQEADLGDTEKIVSRLVSGKYRTGASDLDREMVLRILEDRGYVRQTDEVSDTQRIETYRRLAR